MAPQVQVAASLGLSEGLSDEALLSPGTRVATANEGEQRLDGTIQSVSGDNYIIKWDDDQVEECSYEQTLWYYHSFEYVGAKVAKHFEHPTKGYLRPYPGFVTSTRGDEDDGLFVIVYADGDGETVDLDELRGMFKCYETQYQAFLRRGNMTEEEDVENMKEELEPEPVKEKPKPKSPKKAAVAKPVTKKGQQSTPKKTTKSSSAGGSANAKGRQRSITDFFAPSPQRKKARTEPSDENNVNAGRQQRETAKKASAFAKASDDMEDSEDDNKMPAASRARRSDDDEDEFELMDTDASDQDDDDDDESGPKGRKARARRPRQPKANDRASRRSPRAAAKKSVAYCEASDEDVMDESDHEDKKPAAKKVPPSAKAEEEDFKPVEEESLSDDDLAGIVEEPSSEVASKSKPKAAKKRAPAKPKAKAAKKKAPTKAKPKTKGGKKKAPARRRKTASASEPDGEPSDDDGDDEEEGGGRQSMAESFKPLNVPLFKTKSLPQIEKDHSYLDPCGMEGTDDIVDHLVGDQVDKVLPLLERALKSGMCPGGENRTLKLGTACSGTDAPALYLRILQEQLELRGKGDLFHHTHEFSCELEPFKQAYLARNFDSLLYPDIVKIVEDNPRDVFGKEQPIPKFNFFVAGTSCKEFSMLRSKYRRDIEDKGCSGMTFLSAVEFLFKHQPPFAIFENVTGAPWGKMEEYIQARVHLGSADSDKSIKSSTSKIPESERVQELEFVLDAGQITVDAVPTHFGVRCGSVVSGFMTPDDEELQPVVWPRDVDRSSRCTLPQLMQENRMSLDDELHFEVPCRYMTKQVKMDTKLYGLPQTRNRVYLFVWRLDEGDEDLGDYFAAIVAHLKNPCEQSLEGFILQVDHDIIRNFREALRGPPGQASKLARSQEPDFWSNANDGNLRHNKNAREKSGIEDRARSNLDWAPQGRMKPPPHYWTEFLATCNQRELDCIDIWHASAARDAESHDSNFSSFVWNISQNASKEKHRTAVPGICSCVTPGGSLLLPHLGRPLLGCEKLMVQGIPYTRLNLGAETEVQLGDLAGNAMSMTAVGATMLAAILCKQLKRESKNSLKEAKALLKSCVKEKKVLKHDMFGGKKMDIDTAPGSELMKQLADDEIVGAAIASSIWCTCETSGQNTSASSFLQCRTCRVSCCRNCCSTVSGYQLQSHDTVDKVIAHSDHAAGAFEDRLRKILPASLVFTLDSLSDLPNISGKAPHDVRILAKMNFSLHRVVRGRRYWKVVYFGREQDGSEALAEFTLRIGEMSTLHETADPRQGVQAEFRSFLSARQKPVVRGPIGPIATLTCQNGQLRGMSFKKETEANLIVEGTDPGPSFRKEAGITDEVPKMLEEAAHAKHNAKSSAAAFARGERRRWLYPNKWQEWPHALKISPEDSKLPFDVSGLYLRANCRQTINQGALWIRQDSAQAMYLMIHPNVSRTGPDFAVLTTSISHEDVSAIVAKFPWTWQPSDALIESKKLVRGVKFPVWRKCESFSFGVPNSSISVSGPDESNPHALVVVDGLSTNETNMILRDRTFGDADQLKLQMASGARAQQSVRAFDSICLAKILQFASSDRLQLDLKPGAQWSQLNPVAGSAPFGSDETIVPSPPIEQWVFNQELSRYERMYEDGESRLFYLALEERPRTFEYIIYRNGRLVVNFKPEVVAHNAAALLTRGRGSEASALKVSFRLTSSRLQEDPNLDPFMVHSCAGEGEADIRLREPYRLYSRQAKAVTKMAAIEDGKTNFDELELFEEHMPGSAGWSAVAKAEMKKPLRGGVVADAIGSGKTVVSIALILRDIEEARSSASAPNRSGATLVVLPDHLIDQWYEEIEKFVPSSYNIKVLRIYGVSQLRSLRVSDIIEADCVLCPVDILATKGYLENLLRKSRSTVIDDPERDCPKLPPNAGQKELVGAFGTWIPSSSQDPYGGANNDTNQKNRNLSAWYSHVYHDGIAELRKQKLSSTTKGVPLEYFEWHRIIVDEIHESLCCTKNEIEESNKNLENPFKEKNRRAGREFLGILTKDPSKRPLVFRKSMFGLTGTPLLDSPSRVIELASLVGGTYVAGCSTHWRRLERESSRDIFLHYFLEPKLTRMVRKIMNEHCQTYLDTACCRNRVGDEMGAIEKNEQVVVARMTERDRDAYLKGQSIPEASRSLSITAGDFDISNGETITTLLQANAELESRKATLLNLCISVLETDPTTKIVVFVDGRIGALQAARAALDGSIGCTWIDPDEPAEQRNLKISWYQHGDATPEDRQRPRVLLLTFDQAAGLNLQSECYNLILYTPLYTGQGGGTGDPVADVSTELQAIGRVYRLGQQHPQVNVYRIRVDGPEGEECLDGQFIRRNTDEGTMAMAVNADD